ncbi:TRANSCRIPTION FACTOR BHLH162 [Salix purpurea]|uniref:TRANSCRIPTION FACTOR BHLH162 n=1 Tax=Salix purpurea TaxID=77065 RepID=A0A9Q0W7K4_SALPP|nr:TRANSCRIPTION FACTOR BHLH162 [Salix purpurea]
MKKSHCESTSKLDRKTVERNRRVHMKDLCFKLASMVPHHFSKPSKDMLSQQDQLELAACYIKQMRERVEKLKRVKEQAITTTRTSRSTGMASKMIGLRLPVVELRDFGSSIEVVLVSGLNKNFMFYEVITVLSEEGAEVVSASYSTVGDKVFHTIHAQVRILRVGVETSRVWERLQELIS